jgi:hypothetical protein
MKMTQIDLNTFKHYIAPLDTPERRAQYEQGRIPRADRVADLNVRYRTDLLWQAMDTVPGFNTWFKVNVSSYLNDDHIATALKSFIAPVTRRY